MVTKNEGVVKMVKLQEGYGFIAPAGGGDDVFFHVKDIDPSLPFDEQLQERRVEFAIVRTDKGWKAVAVRAA